MTPIVTKTTRARKPLPHRLLLSGLLALGLPLAVAQVAPTAPVRPDSATRPPANATATTAPADETIVLSPFTVTDQGDEGYRAASTLAGTRINTSLRDTGSAISVLTEQFFKDTGATSAESTLVYATNAEVGGLGGTMSGASITNYADYELGRYRPQTQTRIRGLAAADLTRDLFITDIPFSTYNTGRIDIQRGPNSVLFGLGSPAGIINNVLNQAAYKNSFDVGFRFDQYGSRRNTIALNREILPRELAIHIDTLYNKTEFRQEPAYEIEKRGFAALKYEPKWLKIQGGSTILKASYENGDISANRPRIRPLADQISPWFNVSGLNKRV
ncbi:MAG: TonB-dependent receptor plug domain-containing protein, partial [Opitutaceae bacterium]